MSRPRLMDIDAEMRRAGDAVLDLEARAGVASEAARARDVFPYDTDSDAPFGSALAEAERRREEEDGHTAVVRRIRQVYFGVADADLRRALICGSREVHDLRQQASRTAVEDAATQLLNASTAGPSLWASVFGALASAAWSYGAYHYAGVGAAIALLAAGLSIVPAVTIHHIAERDRAVRRAEDELASLKSMAEEVYRLPHAFSRWEAKTGDPDGGHS